DDCEVVVVCAAQTSQSPPTRRGLGPLALRSAAHTEVMTLSTARLVDAARPIHDRLRRSLAVALRDRVAGEDNAARAAVIWDSPGERWFTPADPIWRVHADAAMFVAGIRGLLLQRLHPLAMAGGARHSGLNGCLCGPRHTK